MFFVVEKFILDFSMCSFERNSSISGDTYDNGEPGFTDYKINFMQFFSKNWDLIIIFLLCFSSYKHVEFTNKKALIVKK